MERGEPEPGGEPLFDRNALKAALPEVSKARYEQTLCAEHPTLKPMLDKLDGEKTQQTPATLAKIWRVPEPRPYRERRSWLKSVSSRSAAPRTNSYFGYHFSIGTLLAWYKGKLSNRAGNDPAVEPPDHSHPDVQGPQELLLFSPTRTANLWSEPQGSDHLKGAVT